MDEIKPTRFSRRTLLNGAAGAALSAILSACTVATATETPARSTPTPGVAPLSPTRAATATGAGTTASTTTGATGTARIGATGTASATGTTGATTTMTATRAGTAVATTPPAPGLVTIATGAPSGTTSAPAASPRAASTTPTRFATPTSISARATGAASGTPGGTSAASASAASPTAMATADLGPAPDPSNFTLVTAKANGNPNGVKVPTDLNGRLSMKQLTVALPASDDPQKMLSQNMELLNYLHAAFAIDVIGAAGKDYTSASDAMAQRSVDVAFLNPAGYALAYRDAGASPLVNGENADGTPAVQNTFIVVRTDDPTKSLVELKAKNIAVVDGDPLPGHWIAAWMLQERGKLVEGLDYTTSAYGTHVDSAGAVIDQRADAGAILKQTYLAATMIGTLDDTKLRVLDSSFDIPGNLMAVRGDISQDDSDLLALAFLTLNDQPATAPVLRSFVLGDAPGTGQFGAGVVKLRRVDDGAYAELRAALDTIKLDLRDAGYKLMQPNAEDPNPYNAPLATKTAVPAASAAGTAGGTAAATSRTSGTPAPTSRTATTATARPVTATPRPTNAAPPPSATARPSGSASATAQPTARSATAPSGGSASGGGSPTATITPRNAPTVPSAGALNLPGSFVTASASTNISGVNVPVDLGGQLSLKRIVIGFQPTNDPARTLSDYSDLLAYLRSAFGIEVIGAANKSGTAILDALRNTQLDLVFLPNFAYLLAHQNANAQALIQGEGPDGKPVMTNTAIIARADSVFTGVGDLRNTNIGFVETDPIVGRVVPTFMLRDRANFTEGKDYRVTSIGTHADAYQAVLDGVVDVGAVAADALAIGLDAGTFDGNAIKILDTSFAVPESVVAIRGDISNTDADRIGLAFLTINDQQRATRLFTQVVQPPPKGKGVFGLTTNKIRRADDGTYSSLRDAVSRISFNLQALLK